MKYVNKKTKCVIVTNCKISGGDWELLESGKVSQTKAKTRKSSRKKDDAD